MCDEKKIMQLSSPSILVPSGIQHQAATQTAFPFETMSSPSVVNSCVHEATDPLYFILRLYLLAVEHFKIDCFFYTCRTLQSLMNVSRGDLSLFADDMSINRLPREKKKLC